MWQLGVVIVLLHLRILRVALPQLGTKSNRQCVIVTEMLGDILSMYSYRLSDSPDICVPLEYQALLAEMGWLQVTVCLHIQCTSGGTTSSVIVIWYQDTIAFSSRK